jgi:hypothetical protein
MGKLKEKVKSDNERGARQNLIEDLFYDFNRSKAQVYRMNFIRGIFFGFGTLLGGTILVAILVWILSQFSALPYIGDYLRSIITALQHTKP